jgi:hypothetical protein
VAQPAKAAVGVGPVATLQVVLEMEMETARRSVRSLRHQTKVAWRGHFSWGGICKGTPLPGLSVIRKPLHGQRTRLAMAPPTQNGHTQSLFLTILTIGFY